VLHAPLEQVLEQREEVVGAPAEHVGQQDVGALAHRVPPRPLQRRQPQRHLGVPGEQLSAALPAVLAARRRLLGAARRFPLATRCRGDRWWQRGLFLHLLHHWGRSLPTHLADDAVQLEEDQHVQHEDDQKGQVEAN